MRCMYPHLHLFETSQSDSRVLVITVDVVQSLVKLFDCRHSLCCIFRSQGLTVG